MSTRTAPAVLLLTSLLVSAAPAATWTVDAGGGGDFVSIQAAIDGVAAGDVLVTMPGTYQGFTLSKDLVIVGHSAGRPTIGESWAFAANLRLGGLDFERMMISGATGAVIVDDCGFGDDGFDFLPPPALRIIDSSQVHLSRVEARGSTPSLGDATAGVGVDDSLVTITDSLLVGGDGRPGSSYGSAGTEGLIVTGESGLLLSRTSCVGGDGGDADNHGGDGAAAVRIEGGFQPKAVVVARGLPSTLLQGGLGGDGFFGSDGMDAPYAVEGKGIVVVSGVTLLPNALDPSLIVSLPSPPQPFLVLDGAGDGPGSTKRLNVYGPAGNVVWLLASFDLDRTTLFGVDGPLYLDPFATVVVLPITTLGPTTPVFLPFQLPASLVGLEGVTLAMQGFATDLGVGKTYLSTNPAHLLLRR